MSTRPIPTRLALLAALTAAAVACRGGDASPARQTLVDSRSTYDPRSLDPAHANDIPSGRLVADIFDGLTRFTPEAALEPGLAERWELATDGRTYTFHLQRHVTFQNGAPFTAQNVVRSFTRAL